MKSAAVTMARHGESPRYTRRGPPGTGLSHAERPGRRLSIPYFDMEVILDECPRQIDTVTNGGYSYTAEWTPENQKLGSKEKAK